MLTVAAFVLIGLLVVAACETTRGRFVRLLSDDHRSTARRASGRPSRAGVTTSRVRPSPAPVTISGVHLAEGRDGWTLTLSLTPELLALVADAGRTGEPLSCAATVVGRMTVEPNLVPGEPFDLREITVFRCPETLPSATTRHEPTKERHA